VPRPPRDIAPGIFHVTVHSVRETALFRDDVDRIRFLSELARVTALVKWTCVAFCLMRTHYHLILDVDYGAMPRGMKALNFRYAAAFNARHRTRGHVTERRYYAGRVHDDPQLLASFKYVVRNPVTAGLCEQPQDWPWSSYRGTVGLAPAFPFVDASHVLGLLGSSPERAVAALRRYVEES
jgi:REP element-mobilizing transposase RayT